MTTIDTHILRATIPSAGFAAVRPAVLHALLDELDALRAAAAPVRAAKINSAYPLEFLAAYDAGRRWRAGSTPKAAYIQWRARINAGADAAQIIAGAAAYARHCEATGLEKKMAQTFFGPGEHYTADWSIPATAVRGRFDPVAHNNSIPPLGDWFDGLVDITPR